MKIVPMCKTVGVIFFKRHHDLLSVLRADRTIDQVRQGGAQHITASSGAMLAWSDDGETKNWIFVKISIETWNTFQDRFNMDGYHRLRSLLYFGLMEWISQSRFEPAMLPNTRNEYGSFSECSSPPPGEIPSGIDPIWFWFLFYFELLQNKRWSGKMQANCELSEKFSLSEKHPQFFHTNCGRRWAFQTMSIK
jgi:hypothetical protein